MAERLFQFRTSGAATGTQATSAVAPMSAGTFALQMPPSATPTTAAVKPLAAIAKPPSGRLFQFKTPEPAKITTSAPAPTVTVTVTATPVSQVSPTIAPTVAPKSADPFLAKLAEPKNQKQTDEVFQSLVKTEEKATTQRKSVLGELPKIDTNLFIDREYHLKKQLSLVKFLFAFLMLGFFGMFVFFYTQLTPSFDLFGPNTAQKLEEKNLQLKNLQTEVNFLRIQTSQVLLNRFTYFADSFLKKFHEYQVAQTDTKKAEILIDVQQIREEMVEPFEKAREKLLAQNWVTLFRDQPISDQEAEREFDQYLRDRLVKERMEKMASAKNAQQNAIKEQLKSELIRNLELLQLIGKPELKTLLTTNIRDLTHDQLKEFLGKFSRAYANRLGIIYQVKERRVPWARTIREIADKTKLIDPLFRTGFFEKLGGILYSSFDFEAGSGRIAINGRAKSEDGTNFSILANLIDELEGSPLFKETDMRSFSKRVADSGGYEGSFKIDFVLQTEPVDAKDKQYQLSNKLTP